MSAKSTVPDLKQFLEHHIEGYLIGDIRRLQVPSANEIGVGYPLLLTVFSGIEFLGYLLGGGKKERAFSHYWARYLYSCPPLSEYGEPLYKLVRNGISHSFSMKGSLGVLQRSPHLHLKRTQENVFIIDAAEIGDDFIQSYKSHILPILSDPQFANTKEKMQDKLTTIGDENEKAWAKYGNALRAAPQVAIPP